MPLKYLLMKSMITTGSGFDSEGMFGRWRRWLHLFWLWRKGLSSIQCLPLQLFISTSVFQLWNQTLFLLFAEMWFFMTLWIKFATFSDQQPWFHNIPFQLVTHKLQNHFQKHNSDYDTPQLRMLISSLLPV